MFAFEFTYIKADSDPDDVQYHYEITIVNDYNFEMVGIEDNPFRDDKERTQFFLKFEKKENKLYWTDEDKQRWYDISEDWDRQFWEAYNSYMAEKVLLGV